VAGSAPARDRNARADGRRLVAVFALSSAVLAAELVGGYLANSLALLADAAHVFTDLVGLGLALGAIWIARRPPTAGRTFGLYRAEILVAALNAVVLMAMAALILVRAWDRLARPPDVESGLMLAVATAGLIANGTSLFLLREGQTRSLNVRGAYLEVMGDLAGAGAVVVAALAIAVAGWTAADAVASGLIAVLVVPRALSLLRQAVDVLLEATPRGVDLAAVREHMRSVTGVRDVHDLHAWTITSGMNVVSAHVVIELDADGSQILDRLCGCLSSDFDIEHSTFQLEREDRSRLEEARHA
jgi:cobalt-zinc-cadmium efflux system protein